VLSHFSLARHGEFDARLDAAAAAGFSGIGLYVLEYQRLRDEEGLSPRQIRRRLDAHGLVIAEIEVVRGWANSGDLAEQGAVLERLAFEMADEFGSRYLQAIGPYEGTSADAAVGFGQLCDRAVAHGLLVGIEFLPFTNIRTAAEAAAIVDAAARPNGGFCVDVWHHRRGANDDAMIMALPPEKVFAIQISDGPMVPAAGDYYTDCLDNRLPPGEGEFEVAEFIGLLDAVGVKAPISLEVCSAELRARPPADAALVVAEGARQVLAAARSS